MLLLAPSRIAAGLRDGTLAERTKLQLVLIGTVSGMLFGQGVTGPRTYGDMLLIVLAVSVTVVGLRSCYRANGGAAGRDFVERYYCLGVPLSIWVFGSYAVIYYGTFYALRGQLGFDASSFSGSVRAYFTPLALLAMLLYFWLLRRYIRSVATSAPAI